MILVQMLKIKEFRKYLGVFSFSVRNNCSTTLNATKTQNMISSPDSNDDGLYDNNVNCSWSIVALEGMSVELQITVKDIECEFDHLEVNFFCIFNYLKTPKSQCV